MDYNPALKPSQTGQISRIYLENFMTYENIEVKPGYHLNLIIGPNGTGKSSLVCAVLLGLGGKPKTLGRADQISSYIKEGCVQSLIEIELYHENSKNVVVRRIIYSNNQSNWFLNGKSCPASKVIDLRKELNIQIDNLCTFLPQEKVQDFAKMNPQQLLESTQKAVGVGTMFELHEELKKLRQDMVENERQVQNINENLINAKEKNERLEGKVKSIKEKRSLVDRIILLNQKKAWLSYHEGVNEKKTIDEDVKLAERNLVTKQKEYDKVENELKKIEDASKKFEIETTKLKRDEVGKKAVVVDRIERLQIKVNKLEQMEHDVDVKLKEEESKKKEMSRHELNVNKLLNDLKSMDVQMSSNGQNQEAALQTLNDQFKRNYEKETNLSQMLRNIEEEESKLKQEVRAGENERKRLLIRLEILKKVEPDVYQGYEELKRMGDVFDQHVFNPMLLELNVTNPSKAKYLESRVGQRDLVAFTCQNVNDFNTLVKRLRTEMKLKVNIVLSDENTNAGYVPDCPIQNLKHLGFYSYLKDFVKGPQPIMNYLCKMYHIHKIPVGDETTEGKIKNVPENITMFYSENHQFTVRTSNYSGVKSSIKSKIRDPKWFSASYDMDKVKQLKQRENNIRQELERKVEETGRINQELKVCGEELEELRSRKRLLKNIDEQRKKILTDLKRAQSEVDIIKRVLKDPKLIRSDAAREAQSLKKEIDRCLKDVCGSNRQLDEVVAKRHKLQIESRVDMDVVEELRDKKSRAGEDRTRAQDLVINMRDRQRVIEINLRKLREEAKELTDGLGVGDRGFNKFEKLFTNLPDSVDDIQAEIQDTQARADFLHTDNVQILEEYERRKQEIQRLDVNLEMSSSELNEKRKRVEQVKLSWLNPLNNLIENISRNFERFFASMGCAGEVYLVTGTHEDDFEKYGIKIKVKFRDDVPFQDLDRYLQSGGERAVSTAIYMLALQELTNVPFRIVDEINQGMDPINERRIFELIISVTSSVEASQYFFITPKLLPSIECPDTMSVLCISHGLSVQPSSMWDTHHHIQLATS